MAVPLVRAATAADAEAVHSVHVAAIRHICAPFYEASQIDAWSSGKEPSGYLEAIATQAFFVAVVEGEVVGFSELAPDMGEIRAVYVRPDRVRQHVGSALLEAIEGAARGHNLRRLQIQSTM